MPVPDRCPPGVLALAVVALTACTRPSADTPAPSEPTATPTASPTPAPEPTFDTPPSEEVLAYLTDCRHVIEVPDDIEGNPVDECDAVPFDQNCAPDPSGCWDAGQGCLQACTTPCGACQTTCADVCDACKSSCAPGAEGCLRACAETRATCRTTCMAGLETCTAVCPDEERACTAKFEAQKAERCPDCDEINECLLEHDEYGEDHDVCGKRFAGVDPVCFEWCFDF